MEENKKDEEVVNETANEIKEETDSETVEENITEETKEEASESLDTKAEETSTEAVNEEIVEPAKKETKKTPWLIAIPVVIVVGLLVAFLIKNNSGKTFKLSEVYSTYFAEKEGSVKFPSNWAVDNSGLLYGVDDGILSQKGYLVGFDCDEDTFDGYVEEYGTAYEVSEVSGLSYKCYTFSETTDDATTKVYFCYKDDVMVEIIVVDENANMDTILKSLTF